MNSEITINTLIYEKLDTSLLEEALRHTEHWWLYVSPETSQLSKVRARVNSVGYLVTGHDMQTQIVCIKDEELTLSDHGCVNAVRFDDPRLSVLLPPEFFDAKRKRISVRKDRKEIKMLCAAHHFVFHSKDIHDIAKIAKIKPGTITSWVFAETNDYWKTALAFWGYTGDPIPEGALEVRESLTLQHAETRWTKLFETLKIEPVTFINIISL